MKLKRLIILIIGIQISPLSVANEISDLSEESEEKIVAYVTKE